MTDTASTTELDLQEAIALLTDHAASASEPSPSAEKLELPLDCLQVLPAAFQPRSIGEVVDPYHVSQLAGALGNRGDRGLDPILVYWSGQAWFVIDGHHRVAAYRSSTAWDKPTVAVEVFEGDANAAIAEATERNMKTNLPLLKMDKSNSGWRLVCLTEMKVKDVMAKADISRSQVIKMRARLREIEEKFPERFTRTELAGKEWREVLKPSFGGPEESREIDDEWVVQLAHDFHSRLKREFKDKLVKNPEAFALAIRLLHNGLPSMLMESTDWEDDRNNCLDGWLDERAENWRELQDAEYDF